MALDEEGGRSCHVRCGHARPGQRCPVAVHRREHADAWCSHVRLQPVRDRGRPDRGEPRVHALRGRAAHVHGSHADRTSRVRRRGDRAGTELAVVVARRYDRHDAGSCRGVEGERDDVSAGLDLRLAAREVDDVHAVGDSCLDRRDDRRRVRIRAHARVGLDEDLVVPEIRAGSDTGDTALSRRRVGVPGGDAGDVCAVTRVALVVGHPRARKLRARGCEDTRDDHLRGGERALTLGEALRHRVARRVEERVRRVDARVDDPDLDALARRVERCAPQGTCADLLGRRRELRLVASGREDVPHARERAQVRHLALRQRHGEPVRHQPVAPADSCVRNLTSELSAEGALLGLDRRGGVRVERERS